MITFHNESDAELAFTSKLLWLQSSSLTPHCGCMTHLRFRICNLLTVTSYLECLCVFCYHFMTTLAWQNPTTVLLVWFCHNCVFFLTLGIMTMSKRITTITTVKHLKLILIIAFLLWYYDFMGRIKVNTSVSDFVSFLFVLFTILFIHIYKTLVLLSYLLFWLYDACSKPLNEISS